MKQDVVLENGLRFISHENNGIQMVDIGLYFKAGSVYETKKNNGITHLAEHMFFRQLNNISQEDLYFKMESIGTTLMAKTYKSYVCFNMLVLPQFLDDAIEIMRQILMDFAWKKGNIEKEKKIVKKQIEFKYPTYNEYLENLYFEDTKYAIPIIGTQEIINNITKQELNDWKKRFFNCNNACLVLTGNFIETDCEKIIKQFGNISNEGFPLQHPDIIPHEFLKRTKISDNIITREDDISDIWISFDLIPDSEIFYAARFLCSVLGDGLGSKLSLALRDNLALTDEIYSVINVYFGFAKINIEFSVFNMDVEQSLKVLFDQIKKIKNNISEKDYKSSVRFFTDNKKNIIDNARDLNDYYGWNDFILEAKNSSLDYIINEYKKITIEQLKQNAKKIFIKENMIINIKNNNKILKNKQLKKILFELRENL